MNLPGAATSPGGGSYRLPGVGLTFVVIAALAGAAVVESQYMPLGIGGVTQDTRPGGLFERVYQDPSGVATTQYLYCSVPNGRFAAHIAIRNTGPLPVTILGGVPGPGGVKAATDVDGFSLADLATYDPAAGSDPQAAALLPPTTIGQDGVVEAWARFRIGSTALQPGAQMGLAGLFIRYTVLRLDRTTLVPLDEAIGIDDCPRS